MPGLARGASGFILNDIDREMTNLSPRCGHTAEWPAAVREAKGGRNRPGADIQPSGQPLFAKQRAAETALNFPNSSAQG
jgi:hypothetical protein